MQIKAKDENRLNFCCLLWDLWFLACSALSSTASNCVDGYVYTVNRTEVKCSLFEYGHLHQRIQAKQGAAFLQS
jgi:hypothetical protein